MTRCLPPVSAPSRPLAHHRPLCIQRRSSLACSPRHKNLTIGGRWSTNTVTRIVATPRFWLQCTNTPPMFQVSEWCVWIMWRRKVSAARFPSFFHVVAYLSLCRTMSENPAVDSVAVPGSIIQARSGVALHMTGTLNMFVQVFPTAITFLCTSNLNLACNVDTCM